MSKKPVKAQTSGIDLSQLNADQLQALEIEVSVKRREQRDAEEKAAIKKLEDSGKLAEYKKQYAQFVKECGKLAAGGKFDILLPIRFTMSVDASLEDHFSYGSYDQTSPFTFSFNAALFNASIAGVTLTKKQREILNPVVNEYAEEACEDILTLVPAELMEKFNDFRKKFNDFTEEMTNIGVSLEDLQA